MNLEEYENTPIAVNDVVLTSIWPNVAMTELPKPSMYEYTLKGRVKIIRSEGVIIEVHNVSSTSVEGTMVVTRKHEEVVKAPPEMLI